MWFHRPVALVLLAVAAGCSRHSECSTELAASTARPSDEKLLLPTDPNVSVGSLANGVRYVLEPMPNTGRATRLVLLVGAGSLDEGEVNGASHTSSNTSPWIRRSASATSRRASC